MKELALVSLVFLNGVLLAHGTHMLLLGDWAVVNPKCFPHDEYWATLKTDRQARNSSVATSADHRALNRLSTAQRSPANWDMSDAAFIPRIEGFCEHSTTGMFSLSSETRLVLPEVTSRKASRF